MWQVCLGRNWLIGKRQHLFPPNCIQLSLNLKFHIQEFSRWVLKALVNLSGGPMQTADLPTLKLLSVGAGRWCSQADKSTESLAIRRECQVYSEANCVYTLDRSLVLANFMSIWHKLESFKKRGTQLRKYPLGPSTGKPVLYFLDRWFERVQPTEDNPGYYPA